MCIASLIMVCMARNTRRPIGTVLELTYGKAEIVGFNGPWRIEAYRPNEVHHLEPWNAEVRERVMVRDHDDATTRHDKSADYDSRCSCCYLNISHSVAKHTASIGSQAVRS